MLNSVAVITMSLVLTGPSGPTGTDLVPAALDIDKPVALGPPSPCPECPYLPIVPPIVDPGDPQSCLDAFNATMAQAQADYVAACCACEDSECRQRAIGDYYEANTVALGEYYDCVLAGP